MSYRAIDIACELLQRGSAKGKRITNMKLQKLLYYTQGWHLAMQEYPLFQEDFEAWDYGPVCPVIYHAFKHNGAAVIRECPDSFQPADKNIQKLVDWVLDRYGKFDAMGLAKLSHTESPWLDTPRYCTIEKSKIRHYFEGERSRYQRKAEVT